MSHNFYAAVEGGATELAIHRDFEEFQLHFDAKMVELKADLIKWVIGISAAQAALIVTLVKFIK